LHQPKVALLDEIEEPKPWSVVPVRNRDNKAQVGFHERSPRALVARLCGPCERNLIVGCQKREAVDFGQVRAEQVLIARGLLVAAHAKANVLLSPVASCRLMRFRCDTPSPMERR
jgi:hypothetical protein